MTPLGFKSYSHMFYFDKQPDGVNLTADQLLEDTLDRDAYFVIRMDKKEQYLSRYPFLEVLYELDGFVFTIKRSNPME